MNNQGNILLEMDIATVGRLLQSKAVSVEDIHSVDSNGKRRLRGLLLEILKRELTNCRSREYGCS